MPIVSESEDTYRKLVDEDKDTSWLMGLLAFAIVEEQRIEWARHWADQHGEKPTPEQVADWYRQQPSGVLLRAKGDAENVLSRYAEDVLNDFTEAERQRILESTLVSEIRQNRKFWPQFGTSAVAGLFSALVFGIVLASLVLVSQVDNAAVKLGMGIMQNTR
ncbi:MAG: hypothetical protein ACR2OV_15405 [Hyphomicrobiaceae bacterium]